MTGFIEVQCGVSWVCDWLMFVDDTVLLGDSEEKLDTSTRIWKSVPKEEVVCE